MLGEMHHPSPRAKSDEKIEELQGGLWRLMHKPQHIRSVSSLVLEDEKQVGRTCLPWGAKSRCMGRMLPLHPAENIEGSQTSSEKEALQ